MTKKWLLRAIVKVPTSHRNICRTVEYQEPVEAETRKDARLLTPQKFPGINLNSDKVRLVVSNGR